MAIQNRYDFVFLFDVKDGNPNGDPDAGNLPRVDAETEQGLVTDVCIKRKIRNYVQMAKNGESGFDIYVTEKAVLQDAQKSVGEVAPDAKKAMCEKFFDIRTFGAVMPSLIKKNAGQVRGPVQFAFARSVDPVFTAEHCITRMAVETKEEAKKQAGDNRTMGRKATVPYGLYRLHGFVNPFFAEQTGFSEDDLNLLWDAFKNMFDLDRSAARGLMSAQKLVIFKHASSLGNAPANKLFERVKVTKKEGVSVSRDFSDYEVSVDKSEIPGVEIIEEF